MTINVRRARWCDVPRRVLVERLRDTTHWPEWSAMETATIERPGRDGSPSSPGEIRRFTSRGVTGREEVLESDGDVVLRYRLLSGLPLRDYVGEVTIEEIDARTHITWASSFEPKYVLTGWLYKLAMGRLFDDSIAGLIAGPR